MKQLTQCFAVLAAITICSFQSKAQVTQWISTDPGTGVDVCLDQFDNVFSIGQYVNTISVGSYTFNCQGQSDVIVQKHDPSGNLLWANVFGGTSYDTPRKIIYDNAGNLWMTGIFQGTINIGANSYTSVGDYDVFVVKMNAANGAILFAETGGGTFGDQGMSIQADALGNIYVGGIFGGNFTFGGLTLNGVDQYETFLLKLNSSGSVLWGKTISGTNVETMWSMATDASGNSYLAGYSTSTTTNFGGTNVTMVGNHFFAKFDTNGNFIWELESDYNGEVYDICVNNVGELFFTGNFDTQATFGSITLTNGSNDNIIVGKINANATYDWVNNIGSYAQDGGLGVCADQQGNVFATGNFGGTFAFGGTNITAGSSYNGFISKMANDGSITWVVPTNGNYNHIIQKAKITSNGDIYMTGSAYGSFTLGAIATTVPSTFIAKMSDNSNNIKGIVFRDVDNNGVQDVAENGVPNAMIQLDNGNYFTASNNQGIYNAFTDAGTHSIAIPNLPLYHTLTTSPTQSVNFIGLGNLDTTTSFGLYPTPNINDLRVDITPISVAKAGYALGYMITYKNVGTTSLNATINLQSDGSISYVTSSPSPTSQSGQSTSWNLGTIAPQTINGIQVFFNIPSNAAIGTPIVSSVNITPTAGDFAPGDNSQTVTNLVTGPFDPNFKEVSEDTLYDVSTPDWLDYVVHFQNVGNDTAYNVIIIDTLSNYLDLGTLEIVASSFPVEFSMRNGNVAEFRFTNIYLPDSTTNQLASNGFVKFRMKYLNTLPLNESIDNFADIYFDYNEAVRTNTAQTWYLDISAGLNELGNKNSISVYPNPANAVLTIVLPKELSGASKVTIKDLNGKSIIVQNSTSNESILVNVEQLQQGIYFVELENNSMVYTQRIIKL